MKQENYVGARDRGQIGDRNAAKTTYIFRHHSYSGAGVAGVTWSLISGTMVEIGFSKKKMVTQKRLRPPTEKGTLLAALFPECFSA